MPDTVHARRMYLFLLVLTLASTVAFQGWRTLLNNFAVESVGVDGMGMGLIQSLREVPGFLALLAVPLLAVISDRRLAALSVVVLGAGVAAAGWFPSLWGLVATTMIMSFGFHYYETMNMSLALIHFDHATAPVVAGKLRGWMGAGNLAAGAAVFMLAGSMEYPALFMVMGAGAVLVGGWCVLRHPGPGDAPPQARRWILRRRYWLFYALTLLAGARRQVFVAFAVFLLVQRFGFTIREVTVLFIVNNVIAMLWSPLAGRAVVRLGERAMLSLEYGGLLLVFMGYALTDDRWVAAGLYVLDHILYVFAFAIRTYFQKIADPGDIAPSMAVGFTINHVTAVAIPFAGGALWMVDYRIPFLGGAALALVSLALVQLIRVPADRRQG